MHISMHAFCLQVDYVDKALDAVRANPMIIHKCVAIMQSFKSCSSTLSIFQAGKGSTVGQHRGAI